MKKYLSILILVLLATLVVGSAQAEERMYLEVAGCDWWQDSLIVGDQIAFQHGIGFGDYETAVAERAGQEAYFLLDGEPLGPVYYEGLTEHSSGFYGDRARVDWDVKPGEHTIQSYWSHENEGYPGDTCTFKAEKVKNPRVGESMSGLMGTGPYYFPANQPFHIITGWSTLLGQSMERVAHGSVRLFLDGTEVEEDFIEYEFVEADDGLRRVKWFVFNFADGMEDQHTLQMYFENMCWVWLNAGYVEDCAKPNQHIEILLVDRLLIFE